jgi:D-tyrosyl-tRNA(Tyr) deacylase
MTPRDFGIPGRINLVTFPARLRAALQVLARTTMRVVLQRVSKAAVRIDGRVVGSIGTGFCLLVGFTHSDTAAQAEWMAEKISGLRLFPDAEGKMNLGLAEVGGAVLVVSQFTLYGDAEKGRRPSFVDAAPPEVAVPLYEGFIAALRDRNLEVATGRFGAMMEVDLVNDGPVTLVLERSA